MKSIVCNVLLLFILPANVWPQIQQSQILGRSWNAFKLTHGKTYLNKPEELYRLDVFTTNLETIINHNNLHDQGVVSYRMGVNQFADMTPVEFIAYVNRYRLNATNANHPSRVTGETFNRKGLLVGKDEQLPKSVDWRQMNAVSEVKNQGKCGSCWSFSTTGVLEGQMAIQHGKQVSLSEQNLIDCAGATYGNLGCDGGLMTNAYEYLQDRNNGVETEVVYPYEARKSKCRFKPKASVLNVDTYVNLPEGDENALKEAVAKFGPIAAGIDATIFLQFYKTGVYQDAFCDPEALNHGILIVGYGTEGDKDYWLVKNSWGPHWGEQGFVKMRRNVKNQCGIATLCSYATILV